MSQTNHLNIIDLYLLIEREKSSICINKEMKKLIKKRQEPEEGGEA